ncbi:SusD/RagB family nutrient-binding outer membrane lipoprotein [Flagellimonas meishanensis]|uniref:SusD/RagB family nutrient-binding outer membrane lipoprotein n=1 Tax=Flagellimonas meishanensis TaxID=2873264 RepID=UPI001CA7338F|nr:SusD/RagB family nutrient-binding outer membrane lipoprotein [[Muricauda] meishanensis]
MKKLNKYLYAFWSCCILLITSCETVELDITKDPNFLVPGQADVDFFLTAIQEDFVRHLDGTAVTEDNFTTGDDGLNIIGMELTRMTSFTNATASNYQSSFQGNVFDDEWTNAYRGIIQDIRIMTPLAEEAGFTRHIGIAQFIEAYLITSLVDFFGDIPYTEAARLETDGIENPVRDAGAEVYQAAFALLDQAIANFNSSPISDPTNDFFYGNDYGKWVRAANTLKLRLYLNTRLVDSNAATSFNAIIASGDYIQDAADDFQWNWTATSATNPDTRHPRYGINYTAGGGTDYMSNWLMNQLDTTDDPRLRYYIYRQTPAVPGAEIEPNEETLRCSLQQPPAHYVAGGFTFCWLDNGYWGRDHGDSQGIPPDGLLRATWGVYPVGGRFDDSTFTEIAQPSDPSSFGGNGAGITPIMTSFMVDFWRAEMALVAGNSTEASTLLNQAMATQIEKVRSFGGLDQFADQSFEPSDSDVTSYVTGVINDFDTADNGTQWDILGEQVLIGFYGNGVDPYNFYRRTGAPTTLQPNQDANPGNFMRSMYYPAVSVNANSNSTQKATNAEPVFWDNTDGPPAN